MRIGGHERRSDLPKETGILYSVPPALLLVQSSSHETCDFWGTCVVTDKCLPLGVCSCGLGLKQHLEQKAASLASLSSSLLSEDSPLPCGDGGRGRGRCGYPEHQVGWGIWTGLHSWAAEDRTLSSLIENRVCVVTKLKFPSQGLQDGICKAPWCEVLLPLHTPHTCSDPTAAVSWREGNAFPKNGLLAKLYMPVILHAALGGSRKSSRGGLRLSSQWQGLNFRTQPQHFPKCGQIGWGSFR